MKRKITSLAIAATMLLATALPALAAGGKAPDGGCQVGATNEIVGEWQLFSRAEFAEYLVANFGWSEEGAEQKSISVYAFNDHNNDGYACVMEQNLPNDASGWDSYWLVEDNHPYGGP